MFNAKWSHSIFPKLPFKVSLSENNWQNVKKSHKLLALVVFSDVHFQKLSEVKMLLDVSINYQIVTFYHERLHAKRGTYCDSKIYKVTYYINCVTNALLSKIKP